MIKRPVYILLLLIFILISCNKKERDGFSFYYWKSKAKSSDAINDALIKTQASSIYLHFFDVDVLKKSTINDDGLYPEYVLTEVDSVFKKYYIIPVIFITNKTLKQETDLENLSERISKLINSISEYHFNKIPEEIQLDCDWTEATANSYFKLIKHLKKSYKVSATIRLHQIKFPDRTGVPPVDKGVLMLYNVGDLTNMLQNSILKPSIVGQYINEKTDYPLELDVALPLFSQTVVENNDNEYRLINKTEINSLKKNSDYFLQTDENLFKVVKDTLYEGLYLSEGYKLKIEQVSEDDIISSYNILKNSKLDISGVIFYHLDDSVIKHINLNKLIQKL